MAGVFALVVAFGLGLSRSPMIGIACHQASVTTCGRVGIAVWLRRPARGAVAVLAGQRVVLHAGGLGGVGPTYWEGYAHLNRSTLHLPTAWEGDRPVRFLRLRLAITYAGGVASGALRLQLRPGWG